MNEISAGPDTTSYRIPGGLDEDSGPEQQHDVDGTSPAVMAALVRRA